jgi:DNA-binding transcriptional MerR regulator
MKIGHIAARLGTTVRTLRFYEEQGLVTPRRSPGGTRRYDEKDVARFAAILQLAGLGIPIAEIRALAGIRPAAGSGAEASHRVESRLAGLTAELARQRKHIEQLEQDIARARRYLPQCHPCMVKPQRDNCASCEVTPHLLQSKVMHIVWD